MKRMCRCTMHRAPCRRVSTGGGNARKRVSSAAMAVPMRVPRSDCKVRSLRVHFSWPQARVERWLPDVLNQATYVINLPIAKKHVQAPDSLGFKNHYRLCAVRSAAR